MCSGRIDPLLIISAFERGIDGVLVTGCHLGDCHYLSGNYHAKYRVLLARKILERGGLETQRLRLEWISAAEGIQFADLITEFTETIYKLGPSPVKTDPNLRDYLACAKKISSDFRLRWITSRARDLVEIKNAYGERIPEEKFNNLLDFLIEQEIVRTKILRIIEEQGLSAENISQKLEIPIEKIMKCLISLNDEHKVSFNVENHVAIFKSVGETMK
jgi:F420-non-reducing hydrogenase iron-sulfur subunit